MKYIKFTLENKLQDYSGYMDFTIGTHLFNELKKEINEGQDYLTIVLKTKNLEIFLKQTQIKEFKNISENEYNLFIGEKQEGFYNKDFIFINSACLNTSIEDIYNPLLKRFYKKEFVNILNGQKTIAGNTFFVVYNNSFYSPDGEELNNKIYSSINNIFLIK